MRRIAASWQLFKNGLEVLGRNKKLLVFPLVIACFTTGLLLSFIAPGALQPTGHRYSEPAHWKAVVKSSFSEQSLQKLQTAPAHATHRPNELRLTNAAWGYLVVVYLALMIAATFFNVAFYHEILKALRGGTVSIRDGLRFAASKLPAIILWSLMAGVVGYVIRVLEQRMGLIGRLTLRLIGVAWSVASVFAIPVLIESNTTNPLEVLRQSAATLRKAWGETVVGFTGFGLFSMLIVLGSMCAMGLGMWGAVALHSPVGMTLTLTGWAIGLLVFIYVQGVVGHVFRCALYLHATDGTPPAPFDATTMELAWKTKRA
jgi:hypothetical protein